MSLRYVAAIDPLALLLPSNVYVKIVPEGRNPHVPKVAEIRDASHGMTADERAYALKSAQTLVTYGKLVEEALGGQR